MASKPDETAHAAISLTHPRRFVVRMSVFLVIVLGVVAALIEPIMRAFAANPALNGLIAGALLAGIFYSYRQVWSLNRDISWMERFENTGQVPDDGTRPLLLVPMAQMMSGRGRTATLSALSTRSILDSIAARLDEQRDISRYMTGLLIFLGLLGTFWGLLSTITSVGDTINSLSIGSGDAASMFGELKQGLAAPLDGMGTAFSSSLFGLAGSLVLGFLDLQSSGAQARFYNELEEWLSARTRLSSGSAVAEMDVEASPASVPAYITALLEQTADSLDGLQRTLARTEERRVEADRMIARLSEQMLAAGDSQQSSSMDEAAKRHLVSIDAHLARLVDDSAQGRADALADIRADIKLLARTIAQMNISQQDQ